MDKGGGGGGGSGGGSGGGQPSRANNFVDQFDSDRNGQVSRDEVKEQSDQKFGELNRDGIDKNRDGMITARDSFNTHNKLTNSGADTNGDRKVSLV